MKKACQWDDPCTSRPWASVFLDHSVLSVGFIVMYTVWEELN